MSPTGLMNVEQAVHELPKVELHIHILGTVRPKTLLEIIQDSDRSPNITEYEVRKMFEYTDFRHFIETYKSIIDYVTDELHFERIAFEMLEDCAACNTKYVEASFSPIDHVQRGLDYHLMIGAVRRGLHRAEREFNIDSDIRIDLVRHSDTGPAMRVLDWVESDQEDVVSVDIGGSEDKHPPAPFVDVYERAEAMGLHLVAHAGEAAGAWSIWDAVKLLGVERIGHGVTAKDDPKLMAVLKERGIVIESCPVSNLRTKTVSSIEEHPIREFFDYGLAVTVNSDDPTLFNTDLNNEYLQLHRHLGFTLPELFQISLNAVEAAFIEEEQREQLRLSFVREYERIQDELD